MKKVFILFAAVALFASCTSSSTTEETATTTVDSTSTEVAVVDTNIIGTDTITVVSVINETAPTTVSK